MIGSWNSPSTPVVGITYNNNKIMSNQIIRRKELINGNRREKTEDEW